MSMEGRWIWLRSVCAPLAPRLHPRYIPNTRQGRAPLLRVTVTTAVGCHNRKHATVLSHRVNGFSAGPRKHKQTRSHLRFFPSNGMKVSLFSFSQLPARRGVIHCAHLGTLTTISVANMCKAGDPFKDSCYKARCRIRIVSWWHWV